ncbi:hypothetical protein OJ936_11595, partial [Streptococcus anginosus]|nr:hypothetical protein [Streptococcus anginosus]
MLLRWEIFLWEQWWLMRLDMFWLWDEIIVKSGRIRFHTPRLKPCALLLVLAEHGISRIARSLLPWSRALCVRVLR